jgi:hypothetical protein
VWRWFSKYAKNNLITVTKTKHMDEPKVIDVRNVDEDSAANATIDEVT